MVSGIWCGHFLWVFLLRYRSIDLVFEIKKVVVKVQTVMAFFNDEMLPDRFSSLITNWSTAYPVSSGTT